MNCEGQPFPPGASWEEDGWNFTLYSRHATAVTCWYGADGPVDFGPESRCLAYCLIGERRGEGDLYVMINASWQPVLFRVQEGDAGGWNRFIDTSRPSPDDILEPESEENLESLNYHFAPRSIAVLVREPTNAT